jgi:O-acetylserine/cysteine efflux transporter
MGCSNGGLFLLVLNLALMATNNVGALAIAGQLGVPFSLLLGALILRERLSAPRLAGVAIAFAGVVLLVFDPHAAHELKGLGADGGGIVPLGIGHARPASARRRLGHERPRPGTG